ncbi:hypothetical protein ANO11243_083360 [Dothideomycetidae sp. 11243]|nr:hypothetical protein ANO11243_083360 [fungal sp. No.11243]
MATTSSSFSEAWKSSLERTSHCPTATWDDYGNYLFFFIFIVDCWFKCSNCLERYHDRRAKLIGDFPELLGFALAFAVAIVRWIMDTDGTRCVGNTVSDGSPFLSLGGLISVIRLLGIFLFTAGTTALFCFAGVAASDLIAMARIMFSKGAFFNKTHAFRELFCEGMMMYFRAWYVPELLKNVYLVAALVVEIAPEGIWALLFSKRLWRQAIITLAMTLPGRYILPGFLHEFGFELFPKKIFVRKDGRSQIGLPVWIAEHDALEAETAIFEKDMQECSRIEY